MVKFTIADEEDQHLLQFCHDIANICSSHDFKELRNEMEKLYKKSGVKDASRIAFQDTLFSIYLEQGSDANLSPTSLQSPM